LPSTPAGRTFGSDEAGAAHSERRSHVSAALGEEVDADRFLARGVSVPLRTYPVEQLVERVVIVEHDHTVVANATSPVRIGDV